MSILGFLYIVIGAFAYFGQTDMIYQPDNRALSDCPVPDGVDHWQENGEQGLLLDMGNDRLVVFFHGNAGSACDWRFLGINHFMSLHYDVLVVEYPGYSNDPRIPSKSQILETTDSVASWVETQQYELVVAMGYSLGTGPASYYAQNYPTDLVLLFAPFDNMYNVAWAQGFRYPRILLREDYDNGSTLADVNLPIHILHGDADQVIPIARSQALMADLEARGRDVHRQVLPNVGHQGLFESPRFDDYLDAVLPD